MSFYNKIPMKNIIKSLDLASRSSDEQKITEIINSINKKTVIFDHEVEKIERIFFIWIGTIKSNSLEYIETWIDSFQDRYDITLYIDSHFLLFNQLKRIFDIYYNINTNTSLETLISKQNDFHFKIRELVSSGHSFDESLILIAKEVEIDLVPILRLSKLKISKLSSLIKVIDIQNIQGVFYSKYLEKMYFNELTLRQNAACATDILRLSLLYRIGGMYVDVDTLPSYHHVYKDINAAELPINENTLDILKSEYLLRETRKIKPHFKDRSIYLSDIEDSINDKDILAKLKECSTNKLSNFYNQGELYVRRDIIRVATQNRLHEINNNVLLANKGSRSVRIILKEITRRYKYLQKNNLIYSVISNNVKIDPYFSRLDRYRYDTIENDNKTEVTLILTGPCLIHEILLGLCYEVLNIPKDMSPFLVTHLFHINRSFLGFDNQINYTPEHVRSSWLQRN